MSPPTDTRLRYLLSIVFVVAAVVLRMMLSDVVGMRAVGITFFPAIILAALYGGRGPGLLAGVLSVVAINFFWMGAYGSFTAGETGDWFVLAILMASAAAISFLAEAMQKARARAASAEADHRLTSERLHLEESAGRAERRLEETRARLAAIVENSDDAIIGKTLDGIITTWNRGATRLLGYSAAEIVGQPVLVLIPPERHNEEADILGHIKRGESVEHFETVRRRKDGTLLDVSLTSSPIKDGEGKIIGASKIVRDITARKQAEARSAADLEAMTHLHSIGSRCAKPGEDYHRCLQALVETAVALTGAKKGNLQLLDETAGVLTIAAQQGFEEPFLTYFATVRAEDSAVCGTAMHVAGRVVVDDVMQSGIFAGKPALEVLLAAGVRAVQSTPLVNSAGRLFGMISTHSDTPRGFSERELRLMDLLARQAAEYLERKQTEAKIRLSELRFRTAVSIVSSLLWTNSAEGKMEGVQPGWGNFTGQTPEEYQGYGWAKAVHAEDAQPTIDAWARAVAGKKLFEFEHRVRRSDGAWRLCSIRAAPVFREEGSIVEWVGVHTDITDQKRSEEGLRRSEERHRALITASSDVIYRMSADWSEVGPIDGRDLVASDVAPSRTWLEDNIFPEDRPSILAAIEEAIRTKGVFKMEHRVRRPDGTAGWTVSRAVPVCDPRGEIVEWFGTASDVTERKQAEEALRESEARKNAILDSALDAIITMDHEGRLVEFNAAAERIFGHARAEVLGQLLAGVIIPERMREQHQRGLARFLATGEGPVLNKQIELPALRADGSEFPAELAIIPIPGTHPPLFTAFLRDVTERRQLEDSLVARAEELARADRSKDEFLAMLAHELRNPLAPLRNATELLKTEDASDAEREQAKRIIGRQIENMSRMLDDLLDVSRITEGKIVLRKKPVALESILTSAASLVRATCAAHGQELAISLPSEPVYVDADATRLEQVFGNLLGNACKYGGEGCHISVSATAARDAQPPEVVVTVRDNGAGIDPELLPRIFDLFVQSSRTLDRAHGGLGIGLTLVQRLVALHGGKTEAHSEGHGHGAEFVVHLPILTEAPPPELLPSTHPPASSRGPSRRILIVDDNTDAARSLATLQELRGHETRTAFTGPDAVAAAADFLPEVVLLDIGLPGMDGFEVARAIREMPALTGVLLIAMSGYGRDEDRAEAKLAGFDQYTVKPVDVDTLARLVAKME